MSIVYSNAYAVIGFCPGYVFFTFNRCEIVEILPEQRKTPINLNQMTVNLTAEMCSGPLPNHAGNL